MSEGGRPSSWAGLPREIVELLGTYLDAKGWAAARASCSTFHAITAGINLLEIDLERDAHRWMMVLTCVARLFPRLNSVALLCGSRITPAIFAERMAALSITSIQLQELELRFLYTSNPRLGSWLEDMSGVTELRQLRALRLAGGATPPPSFFEQLTSLRQLRVLDLLPGVYGQIAGFDMDMAQAENDGNPAGSMGVGDAHLEAIGHLTQLKQIVLKVCPHETSPAGLAGLVAHGLLESLEHLALYDAELPCACLAEHLGSASKLTFLQFGLNSVVDMAVLTRLPKLQDLSLDTAFLPDLRDLVMSAARANIPLKGPGAITGLCLLDQTVSSQEQLACLSQLSSLAELVLVNPLMPPPAPPPPQQLPDAAGDAAEPLAAAGAPAAAGLLEAGQQHLLHGQPCIDLSVLTGLCSLRLLQIDLALRPMPTSADALAPQMQPLLLKLSAASVAQMAAAWTALETLDLSGFGLDLLPEDALAGLSALTRLRSLSIMHPEGTPGLQVDEDPDFDADALDAQQGPPGLAVGHAAAAAAAGPAAAGAAAAGGAAVAAAGTAAAGLEGSKQRSLPWWKLPQGLISLCLSHMDLTGRGSTQCGLTANSSSSNSNSSSGGASSSCDKDAPESCCLVPAVGPPHQQQLLGSLGLGLSLFHNRPSSLRPLSKRRRQTQQRTEPNESGEEAEKAAGGVSATAAAGAGEAAAAAAGLSSNESAAQRVEVLCSCASRLPEHFSNLQALWLEHVALPASFMPRVLPAVATSLESLALLHVNGTSPEDMTCLSSLTALTSLRLIPLDHDVGGLDPLLTVKHLKKLSIKLTHLQPSDLNVLSKLRSLFCLSLAAPCVNHALLPGFPSAVKLQHVVDVVQESLPYCDVELQPEPDMTPAVH